MIVRDLLQFSDTDYANDFEAMIDAARVFSWIPECKIDLWFKAYDTSCKETATEERLYNEGFLFECYVYIKKYSSLYEKTLFNWAAKTAEEAIASFYQKLEEMQTDEEIRRKVKAIAWATI